MHNFDDLPVESDTVIRDEKKITLNELPALYRKWFWDGVKAESLIFFSDDVDALSDRDLASLVGKSKYPKQGAKYRMKRCIDGYTSVDFNFFMV